MNFAVPPHKSDINLPNPTFTYRPSFDHCTLREVLLKNWHYEHLNILNIFYYRRLSFWIMEFQLFLI